VGPVKSYGNTGSAITARGDDVDIPLVPVRTPGRDLESDLRRRGSLRPPVIVLADEAPPPVVAKPKAEIRHGAAGYARGHRCEVCKAAKSELNRKHRKPRNDGAFN
jgi:hypothetical protein